MNVGEFLTRDRGGPRPPAFLTVDRGGPMAAVDLPRLAFVAAVALVALNGCDLLITRHILDAGHGREANPLMVAVIGSWVGVAVKVGVPAVLGAGHVRNPHRALLLAWVCVLYLAVVTWNLHLLQQRAGL